MGITTEYKCDKCEHTQTEVEKPRQMWLVEVGLRGLAGGGNLRQNLSSRQEQMWCRNCVEDVHMLVIPKHENQRKLPEPLAFEELVREIVRGIILEEIDTQ